MTTTPERPTPMIDTVTPPATAVVFVSWENMRRQHIDPFEATLDAEGVVRWTSNGRCAPDLDKPDARIDGAVVPGWVILATEAARKAETAEFVAAYRAAAKPITDPEQLAELVAIHGPGARVVDAISGVVTVLPGAAPA